MATVATIRPLIKGRGRGRGILGISFTSPGSDNEHKDMKVKLTTEKENQFTNVEQSNSNKEMHSSFIDKSNKCDISVLVKKLCSTTGSDIDEDLIAQVKALEKTEDIMDMINAMSAKSLVDPAFGLLAAKVVQSIWEKTSLQQTTRNTLLSRIQYYYLKNGKKLQKECMAHGLCVYLCELFKCLRVNGQPSRAIGDAALDMLKGLINGIERSENDVRYFCQEFENIGSLLELVFPNQLEELVNVIREVIITVPVSPSSRCNLIKVVELYAAKWEINDGMKNIYIELKEDLQKEV